MMESPRTPGRYHKVGIPTRLVFTGNSKVGKTSIINSFFSRYSKTERTREVTPYTVPGGHVQDLLSRSSLSKQGAPFTVQLIDSGGEARLRPAYQSSIYKLANAFIIVCAVDDQESV